MSCTITMINIALLFFILILAIKGGFDNFTSSKTKVLLFWADYCGHCKKLKAKEWPEFVKNAKVKNIEVVEVQADAPLTKEGKAAFDIVGGQSAVPGYPYIVKVVNGTTQPYVGDRTSGSLLAWATA